MDAGLQVLSESLIKFGEAILALGNLAEHIHALLDDVLMNDLEDLVFLESLMSDVKWEILRINNTLDEVEVFGNNVLVVIHDKDTMN